MTPVARNRLLLIGALLVAGAGLGAIAFVDMGENLVYYWSPGELLAQKEKAYGPTIRLGGVVQKGTMQWNPEHTVLEFRVSDGREADDASVLVRSSQVPPQMFREGIGVVVEGTFDKSQVFKTERLMVNHSNEYRPPDAGTGSYEWKETLSDSAASQNKTE